MLLSVALWSNSAGGACMSCISGLASTSRVRSRRRPVKSIERKVVRDFMAVTGVWNLMDDLILESSCLNFVKPDNVWNSTFVLYSCKILYGLLGVARKKSRRRSCCSESSYSFRESRTLTFRHFSLLQQ